MRGVLWAVNEKEYILAIMGLQLDDHGTLIDLNISMAARARTHGGPYIFFFACLQAQANEVGDRTEPETARHGRHVDLTKAAM
jgi:hypothetical protein